MTLFKSLALTRTGILKGFVGLALAAGLHALVRRRAVRRLKDEIASSLSTEAFLLGQDENVAGNSSVDQLSMDDEASREKEVLVKEQLARNYAFLGSERQDKVRASFVVVVGLGGVGSHAVMCLMLLMLMLHSMPMAD
jgi:hypothetical protein